MHHLVRRVSSNLASRITTNEVTRDIGSTTNRKECARAATELNKLSMSQPPLPIVSTLPPRPTFALPPRPSFSAGPLPRDSSISARKLVHSSSPESRPSKPYRDTYIPQSERRLETDRYIPSSSPEPPRRTEGDSYRPARQSSPAYRDTYRPSHSSSSSKRDHRREYTTSRSPETRPSTRRRSPSPLPIRSYLTLSRSRLRSTSRSRPVQSPRRPTSRSPPVDTSGETRQKAFKSDE